MTANVRLERPPATRSNASGATAAGTCSANHAVTPVDIDSCWIGHRPKLPGHGKLVTLRSVTFLAMRDVTDESFERDVLDRSVEVPVVVDLWAEWCGPCKTLGPILEKVIGATEGRVELAKVDVDANPRVSATFKVQSIPAVFALKDRRVIDSFIGAIPEAQVQAFVDRLAPPPSETDLLVAKGDEDSLRAALDDRPGPRRRRVGVGEPAGRPRRQRRSTRAAPTHSRERRDAPRRRSCSYRTRRRGRRGHGGGRREARPRCCHA